MVISRRSALALLAMPAFATQEQRMFLSLNSVLLGGRVQWPAFAELAAKVGFPGTDVMLGPAMQAGADATNALLSRLGVRPAVLDLPIEFRKERGAARPIERRHHFVEQQHGGRSGHIRDQARMCKHEPDQ